MVRRGALRLPLDATRERPRTTLSDSSLVRSLRSAPWASPTSQGRLGSDRHTPVAVPAKRCERTAYSGRGECAWPPPLMRTTFGG